MTKFKRWDEYVTEASHPDFEIPVDDNRTIYIKAPTGEHAIKVQRLTDIEELLRTICGDAADEVVPLVKAAPAGAMNALVTDMMEHFGFKMGETSASSK